MRIAQSVSIPPDEMTVQSGDANFIMPHRIYRAMRDAWKAASAQGVRSWAGASVSVAIVDDRHATVTVELP